jgi:hypothetical protein
METNTASVQGTVSRVRLNVSTTAKGFIQYDITSEFPTLAESKDNLSAALDQVKALIKEKGLVEAHE